MSLDNIKLPPLVLQQLYTHSLIDLKNTPKIEANSELKAFLTLGNNQKKVLILVESEETLYLPDNQLNFLLGILAACNLTMEDVAILNTKKNPSVNYQLITTELQSEKVFLFGVEPSQIELPVNFPTYQIQKYNNQVYLAAPPLSEFQDNKAEKTKLWICLQQIFNI
jgi:DNA polymerase III psi subunit